MTLKKLIMTDSNSTNENEKNGVVVVIKADYRDFQWFY